MDKKEKNILVLVWIFIVLIVFAVGYLYYYWYDKEEQQREHDFMQIYLPEKAVCSIERWSGYYDLDKWLIFNTIMTESNGDQYAKSHANCKGYMQVGKTTAQTARERIYPLIKWRMYNIYNTDINIATGCLLLRTLIDHYTGDDEKLTAEVYNTGWYNYNKRKYRAPKHVKRYLLNKTAFKSAYKKFRR